MFFASDPDAYLEDRSEDPRDLSGDYDEDPYEDIPEPGPAEIALMLDAALDALDPEPWEEGYVVRSQSFDPGIRDEDVPF
jgi:hypothetical protein